MKKPTMILGRTIVAVALAFLAQNAQSQTITTGNLYQDDTTDLLINYQVGNGGQAGNEVKLAGAASSDLITSFSMQYYLTGTTTGNELADVRFYANNGSAYNGYATPSKVLFDSGTFSIAPTTRSALNFFPAEITGSGAGLTPGVGVTVPQTFTWTVTFSGLTGSENAGLSLYAPPTIGSDALPNGDGWINSGSGWIAGNNAGNPLEFGGVFNGVPVPDSSSLSISVMAVLAGFGWMKRFQRQK